MLDLRMTRRRTGDEHGQGLVEIALAIPVLVLALVGIFDVGRLVFTNAVISQAAREGARLAAAEAAWVGLTNPRCVASESAITSANPGAQVCPTDPATFRAHVVDAVNRMAVTAGALSTVYVSCNVGDGADPLPTGEWTESSGGNGCEDGAGNPVGADGEIVSVRVVHTYQPMTPIISDLMGPVTLTGSASMVIN